MLFFIWNEQITAIGDGSTQHYDIFNELYFYAKIKPNFQDLAGLNVKLGEIFIEQPILRGSYGHWGLPPCLKHSALLPSLGFDCMFCLFFKLNMASVLNTVYGWTRSHSLTLLLPAPHISMRGVIILQLAGQQYIVPLSEMGWVVLRWLHTGD